MTRRAIFTVTAGDAAIFSAISRHGGVELVGRHDPRHDAVGERLLGAHRPTGEHHVADDAVPAHLEAGGPRRRCRGSRRGPTSGSMNRAPSAAMRMSQSSARWNEPPIDQPWHGDDDRRVDVEDLLDAPVAPASSARGGSVGTWPPPMAATSRPDENDLPSPRQMTARTSGRSPQLGEDLEEARGPSSSSKALCFSGLSLVMVAIGPSISNRRRGSAIGPYLLLVREPLDQRIEHLGTGMCTTRRIRQAHRTVLTTRQQDRRVARSSGDAPLILAPHIEVDGGTIPLGEIHACRRGRASSACHPHS